MAKQNQKKKPRPSWFQKQIEKGGEEFLLRKPPLDIQRETFNIVRDIARGNITEKDFKYLFTTKILSNMRLAVFAKYVEYHTYNSAITMCLNIPNGMQILEQNYGVAGENLQKVFNNTNNLYTAYGVVLQSIDSMLAAVQFSYPSSEAKLYNYLQTYNSIQHHISRFKYII